MSSELVCQCYNKYYSKYLNSRSYAQTTKKMQTEFTGKRQDMTVTNHCTKNVTSLYGQAYQKHRKELQELYKDPESGEVATWPCYVPTKKLEYVNKVMKDAIEKKEYNPCDYNSLQNLYMQVNQRDLMLKHLERVASSSERAADHLDKLPMYGNLKVTCDKGVVKANFKNPGVYNTYTGEWEEYENPYEMYDEIQSYNGWKGKSMPPLATCTDCKSDGQEASKNSRLAKDNYNRLIMEMKNITRDLRKRYASNEMYSQSDGNVNDSLLGLYTLDPRYRSLILRLQNQLTSRKLELQDFKNIIGDFHEVLKDQETLYIKSLLYPALTRDAKIPARIPTPSSTFQLRANTNLITNALGNVACGWAPFYLQPSSSLNSSFGINNDVTLTGLATSNFFAGVNVGQTLPADLYTRYRLVSASFKITFTASDFTSAGFGTSSVLFDPLPFNIPPGVLSGLSPYGNFNLIENGYYKSTKALVKGQSIETIFLPPDESYLDFYDIGAGRGGFNIVSYITGAPPTTSVARVDIIANFEAIVAGVYTDYLPCNVYTGGDGGLSKAFSAMSYVRNANSMDPKVIEGAMAKVGQIGTNKNQTILLPPSNKEASFIDKAMAAVGDVLTDVAKAAIPLLLPLGGKAISNLLFHDSQHKHSNVEELVSHVKDDIANGSMDDKIRPKFVRNDNYNDPF